MLDIPDDALTAEDEALATRIADLQLPSGSSGSGHAPQASALPEMDDIPDMDDEEVPEGLRVDQYLLVFLKVSAACLSLAPCRPALMLLSSQFMASIVPAIEIDATQAV